MRLLDTNVLAKWGDPTETDTVVRYLQEHASEQFVTSSLVTVEFFRPAKRRANSQHVCTWLGRGLDSIEPFTDDAARQAADVEASLQTHNESLPMRDLLIASHAREMGATFVTDDTGDFQYDGFFSFMPETLNQPSTKRAD